MAFMKCFAAQFFLCRNYSAKFGSETPKWVQTDYRRSCKQSFTKNFRKGISWTEEQRDILRQIPGSSIFITGSAGTGKSELLRHIIKLLRKAYGKSSVFVTASTGVAACAIRGQTINSFAGIGFGERDRDTLLSRVLADRGACRRWKKVDALVMDEVSMVDGNLFDNLEYIARKVRESDKVWGGIKLIVSGDFFQLPPVLYRKNSSGKEFAFEADCWDSSFDIQFELTKVFRQSDPRLLKILQGIRRGNISDEDLDFLQESCSVEEPDSSVVQLYPRIEDVNRVNDERMKALSKKMTIYQAFDEGKMSWKRRFSLGMAPDRLCLCEGARVMLIKNLNVWRGLVNGATGTVTGFSKEKVLPDINPDNLLPVVKFDSGQEILIKPEIWEVADGGRSVASRQQIPLVLAWAFSIHKCQGMTLDRIHTNLTRAFDCGMVYVALSRSRSLEGLHLSGFCPSKIKAHPKVVQFYERFANREDILNEDDEGKKKELIKMLIDSSSKREKHSILVTRSGFL